MWERLFSRALILTESCLLLLLSTGNNSWVMDPCCWPNSAEMEINAQVAQIVVVPVCTNFDLPVTRFMPVSCLRPNLYQRGYSCGNICRIRFCVCALK